MMNVYCIINLISLNCNLVISYKEAHHFNSILVGLRKFQPPVVLEHHIALREESLHCTLHCNKVILQGTLLKTTGIRAYYTGRQFTPNQQWNNCAINNKDY